MSQPTARENDCRKHPTILLVEDDSFVQDATRSILEHAGFSVLACGDAINAIRTYERCDHPIDLVMTDMVLPGRDGRQLGEDLRRRSPQLQVLVTSGYGNAEFETEDPANGKYFLAKPYSRKNLIEKIESILDQYSSQHPAAQAS
jgi:two-component system cell cycle sensor histidine kinase/response regulator CckA